jgi:hypothetical protein
MNFWRRWSGRTYNTIRPRLAHRFQRVFLGIIPVQLKNPGKHQWAVWQAGLGRDGSQKTRRYTSTRRVFETLVTPRVFGVRRRATLAATKDLPSRDAPDANASGSSIRNQTARRFNRFFPSCRAREIDLVLITSLPHPATTTRHRFMCSFAAILDAH